MSVGNLLEHISPGGLLFSPKSYIDEAERLITGKFAFLHMSDLKSADLSSKNAISQAYLKPIATTSASRDFRAEVLESDRTPCLL